MEVPDENKLSAEPTDLMIPGHSIWIGIVALLLTILALVVFYYKASILRSCGFCTKRQKKIGRNGRVYTAEQEALVKQILDMNNAGQMGVHHRVLGIHRLATEDEINRAFRRLALKLHTDKNAAPGASEAFQVLNRAKEECLSRLWERNEIRRRYVDDEAAPEGSPFRQRQGPPMITIGIVLCAMLMLAICLWAESSLEKQRAAA